MFVHIFSAVLAVWLNVCLLAGPTLWSRVKYVNNYWMHCPNILKPGKDNTCAISPYNNIQNPRRCNRMFVRTLEEAE